jgi:hypothetical protein
VLRARSGGNRTVPYRTAEDGEKRRELMKNAEMFSSPHVVSWVFPNENAEIPRCKGLRQVAETINCT